MTIDPAGQRANDTGWTKAAKRAEKKARDKAARKAFFAGIRGWIATVWDFFLRNMVLWLAVAGLIALATWEWWNSARGWKNLYPDAGGFIYIGAIGAVVLYFHSFRQWREHGRANRAGDSRIWLSVTIAAYCVCVIGVFVATATASEKADRIARDGRKELAQMKVDRQQLAAKIELNDPATLKLILETDTQTLDAFVDAAKRTHGMPDLDMGSGCPAPPKKFTMERLCAQANGGIDPFSGEVMPGLRSELKRDQLAIDNAEEDVEALADLDTAIKGFHVQEGDATADALGEMLSMNGGTVLSWLLLFLSSAFLYGGGWLGDWVFERVESMRVLARKAREALAS